MCDLISVVVPVYRVEQYISQCVDSILNQDYRNLEIILVDDGSPDGCGEICDKYCELDNRVCVIHKENGGLSDARNAGLERAHGEYVCFIDSDDYVSLDYVSSMYDNLKKYNTRIACCGFCRVFDNGKKQIINFPNIHKTYIGQEAQKYMNIDGYLNVAAWNKLYDISLFSNIRFPKGKVSEDSYIMYKIFEQADRVYYNSDIKYYYRQRYGSITKSDEVINDTICSLENQYNYYKERGWTAVLPYASQRLLLAYIGGFNTILCNSHIYNKKKLNGFRKSIKQLSGSYTVDGLSKLRKTEIFIFNNCNVLYRILFKIYNKYRLRKYCSKK